MRSFIFVVVVITLAGNLPAFRTAYAQSSASQGEVAQPTVEGDLIKVNNKICPGSKALMSQEIIGKYTGRVVYRGGNAKYQGKTLEFNYCCAMCQNSFPGVFAQDPDSILKFHGLL